MTRTNQGASVVTETRPEKSPNLIGQNVHGYALTTIAAGVLIAILSWARVVFITTITAVIIALILEPLVGILVRFKLPRALAALMVGAIAALGLYFAGLAAYNQLSGLAVDAPAFQDNLSGFITGITDRIQYLEDTTSHLLIPTRKSEPAPVPPAPPVTRKNRKNAPRVEVIAPLAGVPGAIPEVRIHADRNPITDYVYARLGTVYEFLLMASFVPFLVYFMLSWRDHIYKSFLLFFEGADQLTAARSLEGVASMARAFVVGNFMIGVFLSALSWAAFAMLRIPYPFLAGILSAFLSLVPYVGMPLAVLPPVLGALAAGERGSVIAIAFVLVLVFHLSAMNLLYPKIVGARVHLNPLVVTFSLMFWGFLWDAPGLVLAIPITAGIKAVCDNIAGLRPYGRFLGD